MALSEWETVQSCLIRYDITEFSIEMRNHGKLQFVYCVYVCVCVSACICECEEERVSVNVVNAEFSVRMGNVSVFSFSM